MLSNVVNEVVTMMSGTPVGKELPLTRLLSGRASLLLRYKLGLLSEESRDCAWLNSERQLRHR